MIFKVLKKPYNIRIFTTNKFYIGKRIMVLSKEELERKIKLHYKNDNIRLVEVKNIPYPTRIRLEKGGRNKKVPPIIEEFIIDGIGYINQL